jgi:hypothetical protein
MKTITFAHSIRGFGGKRMMGGHVHHCMSQSVNVKKLFQQRTHTMKGGVFSIFSCEIFHLMDVALTKLDPQLHDTARSSSTIASTVTVVRRRLHPSQFFHNHLTVISLAFMNKKMIRLRKQRLLLKFRWPYLVLLGGFVFL